MARPLPLVGNAPQRLAMVLASGSATMWKLRRTLCQSKHDPSQMVVTLMWMFLEQPHGDHQAALQYMALVVAWLVEDRWLTPMEALPLQAASKAWMGWTCQRWSQRCGNSVRLWKWPGPYQQTTVEATITGFAKRVMAFQRNVSSALP